MHSNNVVTVDALLRVESVEMECVCADEDPIKIHSPFEQLEQRSPSSPSSYVRFATGHKCKPLHSTYNLKMIQNHLMILHNILNNVVPLHCCPFTVSLNPFDKQLHL